MRSLDWNSFVIMHRNERVATVDCTGGCVIHNAKFMKALLWKGDGFLMLTKFFLLF